MSETEEEDNSKLQAINEVDSKFADKIQERIYNGRVQLLKKVANTIRTRRGRMLVECRNIPFINQVLGLSRMLPELSDEERSDAIDTVLNSSVYDRVKDEEMKQTPDFDYVDQLVKELLKWFKEEYFTWVNKLPCTRCGNDQQEQIKSLGGIRGYKPEHLKGKASVVERYQCMKCGNVYEFPRYNDIRTLLRSRKGRCGEWNNCFIAILRSLDIDARYIWNAEDHVWCEYFSEKQRRWIHLDACENSYDEPMLYNSGWGKKMSYVFAIGQCYIVDVSEKYLDRKRPELALPRNRAPEMHLSTALACSNAEGLSRLPRGPLLAVTSQLMADARTRAAGNAPQQLHRPQQPRQSGGADWTAARGEAGR